MDFLFSLIDFALARQEQVLEGLAQHTGYVVTVLVSAGLFAILTGVVTRRSQLAKELALSIASVFLTIPSLALFVVFIPLVGLGFAPSFIALFCIRCYQFSETRSLALMALIQEFWKARREWAFHRFRCC